MGENGPKLNDCCHPLRSALWFRWIKINEVDALIRDVLAQDIGAITLKKGVLCDGS